MADPTSIRPSDYGIYGNSTGQSANPRSGAAEFFCFRESATTPPTPTGGAVDFTLGVYSPPQNWLQNPPANPSNIVWVSSAIITPSTVYPTWAIPGQFGGAGSASSTPYVQFISSPTPSSNQIFTDTDLVSYNSDATLATVVVNGVVLTPGVSYSISGSALTISDYLDAISVIQVQSKGAGGGGGGGGGVSSVNPGTVNTAFALTVSNPTSTAQINLGFGAGLVPTANLGTLTASNSNFLRGDRTWASPASAIRFVDLVDVNITEPAYTDTLNTILSFTSTNITTTAPVVNVVVGDYIRGDNTALNSPFVLVSAVSGSTITVSTTTGFGFIAATGSIYRANSQALNGQIPSFDVAQNKWIAKNPLTVVTNLPTYAERNVQVTAAGVAGITQITTNNGAFGNVFDGSVVQFGKNNPLGQGYTITLQPDFITLSFTPALLAQDAFSAGVNIFVATSTTTPVTTTPTSIGIDSKVFTQQSSGTGTYLSSNVKYTNLLDGLISTPSYASSGLTITAISLGARTITLSGSTPTVGVGVYIWRANTVPSGALVPVISKYSGSGTTQVWTLNFVPLQFTVGDTIYVQSLAVTSADIGDGFIGFNRSTGLFNLRGPAAGYTSSATVQNGQTLVARPTIQIAPVIGLIYTFNSSSIDSSGFGNTGLQVGGINMGEPVTSGGTLVNAGFGINSIFTINNTGAVTYRTVSLPTPADTAQVSYGASIINTQVIGSQNDVATTAAGATATANYFTSTDGFSSNFTAGTLNFTNSGATAGRLRFGVYASVNTFIAIAYFDNDFSTLMFYTATNGTTWTAQANKTFSTTTPVIIIPNPNGRILISFQPGGVARYQTTTNYTDFDASPLTPPELINYSAFGNIAGVGFTSGMVFVSPNNSPVYAATDGTLGSWSSFTPPEPMSNVMYAGFINYSTSSGSGWLIQAVSGSVYLFTPTTTPNFTLVCTNPAFLNGRFGKLTTRAGNPEGVSYIVSAFTGITSGFRLPFTPSSFIQFVNRGAASTTASGSTFRYLGGVDDYSGMAFWSKVS